MEFWLSAIFLEAPLISWQIDCDIFRKLSAIEMLQMVIYFSISGMGFLATENKLRNLFLVKIETSPFEYLLLELLMELKIDGSKKLVLELI